MPGMRHILVALCFSLVVAATPSAQSASADSYTRYELLDPASSSFKIIYDVSATTAGARFYFNAIRQGSEASDESVIDRMTGQPLRFEVVSGEIAQKDGMRGADLTGHYIKVHLARPVPQNGETRLRIIKTYTDPKTYFTQGDLIVFDRSLGIKRNAIVLPAGYEIVSSNFPSQVIEESDGRLNISHWNNTPAAAPVVIRARKRPAPSSSAQAPPVSSPAVVSPGTPATTPRNALANLRISERAVQDREIVYFLQQPETHSFRLYHDYTETRPGVATYRNVVRGGSSVSDPEAVLLDTGETLKVETVKEDDAVVVIIHFPAVQPGHSARLRITETYTDPGRYGLVEGQLVWNRNFGRPANDVVLPVGWYLTDSAIPGIITTEADGRTRIAFINPRPDSIDVVLTARRR